MAHKGAFAGGGHGKFDEAKHPRGQSENKGQFKSKAVKEEDKKAVDRAGLKTSGVLSGDLVVVLSGKSRRYAKHRTVGDFLESHPRGRTFAMKLLVADHKKGVIGFRAPPLSTAERTRAQQVLSRFAEGGTLDAEEYRLLLRSGLMKERSELDQQFEQVAAQYGGHIESGRWSRAAGVQRWGEDLEDLREAHRDSGLPFVKYSRHKAVEHYTGEGYREINEALRRSPGDLSGEVRSYVNRLDRLVASSRFKRDTIMYRGFGERAALLNGAPPPKSFRDDGFTSVSYSPTVAKDFAHSDVIYRVRVPEGFPGVGLQRSNGSRDVALEDEAEVLLPRGTTYQVVKRTPKSAFGGTYDVVDVVPLLPA